MVITSCIVLNFYFDGCYHFLFGCVEGFGLAVHISVNGVPELLINNRQCKSHIYLGTFGFHIHCFIVLRNENSLTSVPIRSRPAQSVALFKTARAWAWAWAWA